MIWIIYIIPLFYSSLFHVSFIFFTTSIHLVVVPNFDFKHGSTFQSRSEKLLTTLNTYYTNINFIYVWLITYYTNNIYYMNLVNNFWGWVPESLRISHHYFYQFCKRVIIFSNWQRNSQFCHVLKFFYRDRVLIVEKLSSVINSDSNI